MAVYVVDGKAVRVLELIDIDGRPDVRRARETGRELFLQKVADEARQGRSGQKIRERRMTLEVRSGPVGDVALPQGAAAGILRVLFGPAAKPEAEVLTGTRTW